MRRCFRNLLSVCHLLFILPVLLLSSAAFLSLRREAPARLPAFAILFSESAAQVSCRFPSRALAEAGKFPPVDFVTQWDCVRDCVRDGSCEVLFCVSAVAL